MKKFTFHLIILAVCLSVNLQAQNTIEPPKGYSTQIGNMVAMLDDLKSRVTRSVENLKQHEVDFLLDDDANRIGAMILHLAATEKYYQVFTFENRSFSSKEDKEWMLPLELGEPARKELVNKPISYYLDIWDTVRKETKKLLKTKDDNWFNAQVKKSSMNNHWAWYHVMEHQANHMGQIRLILKRVPSN
tara:strand:- start:39 stop:605 length:567 start_codon:yes stop_codon:yes gene_type:complete